MKPIQWTSEMDNLLGKLSDTDIGNKFNISRTSVYNRRKELDISRYPQQNFTIPLMGGWNKLEWSKEHLQLLGTMPDHALAAILSIDKCTVGRKRNSLNIHSYESQTRLIAWTPQMDALLGTDYDRAVGTLLNVQPGSVAQRRKYLGKASYASQQRLIPENTSCYDPENLVLYAQLRNARKRDLARSFTGNHWKSALDFFDNQCAYCGTDDKLTQDHLIAVKNGGGYVPANIVPACGSCNSAKSTHDWKDWINSRFPQNAQKLVDKIEAYQDSIP